MYCPWGSQAAAGALYCERTLSAVACEMSTEPSLSSPYRILYRSLLQSNSILRVYFCFGVSRAFVVLARISLSWRIAAGQCYAACSWPKLAQSEVAACATPRMYLTYLGNICGAGQGDGCIFTHSTPIMAGSHG